MPSHLGKVELGRDELAALARIAWRRKMLVAFIAATAMTILSTAILSLTPRYGAEAMLLLPSASLGKLTEAAGSAVPDQVVLRSEVEILKSDRISRQVMEELGLGDRPEFFSERGGLVSSAKDLMRGELALITGKDTSNSAPIWTESELRDDRLLAEYRNRLSVFNDGRSSIAYVSFWAENPRLAAQVANAHVKTYLKEQADRRIGAQRVATDWLRHELDDRAHELKAAQRAVQSFRTENGLVLTEASNVRQSTVDQELAQLNQQLAAARGEVVLAEARLEQIATSIEAGTLQGTSDMINSPVLLKLRDREAEAKLAIARLENSFQPLSPGFNAAKAELTTVQSLMVQELARTRQSLIADLKAAQARLALIEKQMDDAKARKLKLDNAQIELSAREAVAASKRSIYDAVLNKFNELLAEQRFDAADAKVIATAAVPTRAIYPKTSLYLLVALLASGALGLAAAYLVERFGGSSHDPHRTAADTGVQLLGVLPALKRKWFLSQDPAKDPAALESVRAIRNRLLRTENGEGIAIAVVATLPNEGRTMVATLLARAMAHCGISTLMLDANMRRPRAAKLLGLKETPVGLDDVLRERASIDEAVMTVVPLPLDVLPAAPNRHHGIDLIPTGAMRSLLERLKAKYRVILIDTPPIAAVADALAVAELANSLVVVADAATRPELVANTVDLLKHHGASISGLVVTGVRVHRTDLALQKEIRAHQQHPDTQSPSLLRRVLGRFAGGRGSHPA